MRNTSKVSMLQLCLVVCFTSCCLIANILANRLTIFGWLEMDAGNLVFPITYILSDLFSEVYGYKWSRHITTLSSLMNIALVAFIFLATQLPAPDYFDASPFATALSTSWRIVLASITSFWVGDWANDRVFRFMKIKSGNTGSKFASRALASSFVGECVDSTLFVLIAFAFTIPASSLLPMILTNVVVKTLYEIIILPVTCQVVKVVKAKEGGHESC